MSVGMRPRCLPVAMWRCAVNDREAAALALAERITKIEGRLVGMTARLDQLEADVAELRRRRRWWWR